MYYIALISISLSPYIKKWTSISLHPCNVLQVQIPSCYTDYIYLIHVHGKIYCFLPIAVLFSNLRLL